MIMSRLRRYEDRKAQKKLSIAVVGSLAVLVFLGVFGLKILVGFSLLVDRIRGNSPAAQQQSNLLLPPVMDPLPEATFSATLSISGKATARMSLVIYVDDTEYKTLTVPDDGLFTLADIAVDEGRVSLKSKITDDNDNASDYSNILHVTVDRKPPTLAVSKPEDGAKIQDGSHKVTIEGMTDSDSKVMVNDRIVVVRGDGSFVYTIPIADGDNTLNVVAIDPAGNRTTVERHVTYQN